jgi:hypothetical protein
MPGTSAREDPNLTPGRDQRDEIDRAGSLLARDGRSTVSKANTGAAAGGGAIYGLGLFGALFYYWQQADTFLEYGWAIFKAIFWPAYMVYEGFSALGA